MTDDALLADVILTGQENWRGASWMRLALVWLFGRHRIVTHLDRRARIGVWRGRVYLLTFGEV